MSWTVEHNPTSAPTIVWTYPSDERSLHRLGSLQCPCHPEHLVMVPTCPQPVAGVIGGMISHQRMTTEGDS